MLIHVASEVACFVLPNKGTSVLRKMDSTGYGSITISEFEKLFEDEDMQASASFLQNQRLHRKRLFFFVSFRTV